MSRNLLGILQKFRNFFFLLKFKTIALKLLNAVSNIVFYKERWLILETDVEFFMAKNESKSVLQRGSVTIFLSFFISWFQGIWAPDKQAKMVLLKNLFSRRYPRNQLLCAVLACAESDSLQANTARRRKFKCPQIQNWLTLCWVRLCSG